MQVAFMSEILPRQTEQNFSLRQKCPTGDESTQDNPQLLKHENWMKHLSKLSAVTSCFLSPTKGFSKLADSKQNPEIPHPDQRKGAKRQTWHSRNATRNNTPSTKCSAECANRKFPDLGSPSTNGSDIQWKQNLSLLIHEPGGAAKVASELLKVTRNTSD